jgi:hypothetical protein
MTSKTLPNAPMALTSENYLKNILDCLIDPCWQLEVAAKPIRVITFDILQSDCLYCKRECDFILREEFMNT